LCNLPHPLISSLLAPDILLQLPGLTTVYLCALRARVYTSHPHTQHVKFVISNFRRVVNVVPFLVGDSPASEFYVATFRNTVFSIFIGRVNKKNNWDETARFGNLAPTILVHTTYEDGTVFRNVDT